MAFVSQKEDYESLTDDRGACHNRTNVCWLYVKSAIGCERNRNPESTECRRIGSKSGRKFTRSGTRGSG
jgi:hypothetical protein